MKLTSKNIAKHWLQTAYDYVDKIQLAEYSSKLEDQGYDLWTKETIEVKLIQTHHDGHDSSEQNIEEYKKLKKDGSNFPPIIVKKISDSLYITLDGQHRVLAADALGDQFIEAYVGHISTETFESRKEDFKEIYSLEMINGETHNMERSKDIHIKIQKFIENSYTEEKPWCSLYLNNNKYTFFLWFMENRYEET